MTPTAAEIAIKITGCQFFVGFTQFEKTSTQTAPWYLVPADNRWYSRAVVSELLRTTLKNMNMTWPGLDPDVDPDEVRRLLG